MYFFRAKQYVIFDIEILTGLIIMHFRGGLKSGQGISDERETARPSAAPFL